jgi:hypothetical protein
VREGYGTFKFANGEVF